MKTIEKWRRRVALVRARRILWTPIRHAPRCDCVVRGSNFWLHFEWTVK